jgi:protein required for attachment to host cells
MQLPKGATVAVADGAKLHLYRNTGDEAHPKLAALPEPAIGGDNKGAGARRSSGAANPDHGRLEEDSFAAATAAWLNQEVLGHRIDALVVIASPKTLGELRKHYHKALQGKLVGELAKDLTGHSLHDVEAALAHA